MTYVQEKNSCAFGRHFRANKNEQTNKLTSNKTNIIRLTQNRQEKKQVITQFNKQIKNGLPINKHNQNYKKNRHPNKQTNKKKQCK